MKNSIASIFFLLVFSSCLAQTNEFSLIGRWQEVEYQGNNGAQDFIQEIENGRILIFENNSIVKDGNGNKGTYEVKGDSLHITLPKDESFYIFYYDKDNVKRLYLSPVTKNYEIICDEGCALVFEKKE